ncbi:serine--tRNA ligase [Candidatus Acetothermia bacterium]|nr:serine--tRNA ligase [Candidatus Acetothermia bacterium]
MLDLKLIRENPKEIERRLQRRDPAISLGKLLEFDEERRKIIGHVEEKKSLRNKVSEQVGKLKREKKDAEAQKVIAEMGQLADEIKALDNKLAQLETQMKDILDRLPNLPHPSVPVSQNKFDQKILRIHKEKPNFSFEPKTHLELAETFGMLDFPRAAKIAGSRFPLYRGWGALLEMGLIQFMFKYQVEKNGYTPIIPPYLGNEESFYASSQFPKFREQVYEIPEDKLFINPTAEIVLCNVHRDEILEADQLPINYAGYTACFRREAGTYGEEERGLIRMHQFNKVELFKFTKPEESYAEHEKMCEDAEDILKELGIHYRAALLPSCDMGLAAAKTIDLEVWIPSQNRYYEVSSVSNCEDFQARRGNIRYRPGKDAKPQFVHTLNGSGLATSRLFIAIIENNQQPDGSVVIPEPLRDYVGADRLKP